MKSERKHNAVHYFSFDKRFDETMRNVFCNDSQCIAIFIRQQICQLSGCRKCHYSQAGRSDIRSADKRIDVISTERKGMPIATNTYAGFEEQKSHSSLGYFLHAVHVPLKSPQ